MTQPSRAAESVVTHADLVAGLRAVGVAAGDVVLAHSSLSAFGHVEGGADTVLDALLAVIGPTGTLVLPTFTWRANHAAATVVFDVAHDPCETGRIPETFRQRPGVRRSEHVCHSFAAQGPRARDLTQAGPRSFGEDSTLHRLVGLHAWNLLLGVGFSSCTALHMVEELTAVPYRHHRDYAGSTVVRPDGTRVPADCLEYLREPGAVNDFAKMGTVFAAAGLLRTTTIGRATVTNLRLRELVAEGLRLLADDPLYLLTADSRRWFGG